MYSLQDVLNYTQVDFNVAFNAPKTISDLFPFKDRIRDAELQSLNVYKINCKTCNTEYIGKTERILINRMEEHAKSNKSAFYQRTVDNHGHEMDYENIKVFQT